jgi:hypothetical protein
MRRTKIVFGLVVLALAGAGSWQIGVSVIANVNLQEDMRDMGSLAGTHMGLVAPTSDEELARAVIRKAKERGIELNPAQVTMRRLGSGERQTLYLAADYSVPVNLGLFSFRLHFTPSSEKGA